MAPGMAAGCLKEAPYWALACEAKGAPGCLKDCVIALPASLIQWPSIEARGEGGHSGASLSALSGGEGGTEGGDGL